MTAFIWHVYIEMKRPEKDIGADSNYSSLLATVGRHALLTVADRRGRQRALVGVFA